MHCRASYFAPPAPSVYLSIIISQKVRVEVLNRLILLNLFHSDFTIPLYYTPVALFVLFSLTNIRWNCFMLSHGGN